MPEYIYNLLFFLLIPLFAISVGGFTIWYSIKLIGLLKHRWRGTRFSKLVEAFEGADERGKARILRRLRRQKLSHISPFLLDCLETKGSRDALKPLIDGLNLYDRCARELQRRNLRRRISAARILGYLGNSDAIGPLLSALPSSPPELGIEIVGALDGLGTPRLVESILRETRDRKDFDAAFWASAFRRTRRNVPVEFKRLLLDEDTIIRLRTVQLVGQWYERLPQGIEKALYRTLKDSVADVRREVCRLLKARGHSRALPHLIELVKEDLYPEVRHEAALAAMALDLGETIDHLSRASHDERWWVRSRVVESLGVLNMEDRNVVSKIEPLLFEALDDVSPRVRKEAASVLERAGTLERRIQEMRVANSPRREEIERELSKICRAGSFEGLIPYIGAKGDDAVTPALIRIIGRSGNGRCLPHIIRKLRDESRKVRIAAVKALGDLRDHGAITSLIEALKDGDGEVRLSAVESLGKLGNERAIEPLIALLRDGDESVHRSVGSSLRSIGTRSVEHLVSLLDGSRGNEQRMIIDIMGQFEGGHQVVEPLLRLLGDHDPSLREAIASALLRFEDNEIESILLEIAGGYDLEARLGAIWILGRMQSVDTKHLLNYIKDPNSAVRLAVVEAISERKDPSAEEHLVEALKDPNKRVRLAAVRALEGIRNENVDEVLREMYSDPTYEVRETIVNILVESDDSKSSDIYVRALNDPDERVRNAARDILLAKRDVRYLIEKLKSTGDLTIRTKILEILEDLSELSQKPLIDILENSEDGELKSLVLESLERMGVIEAYAADLLDIDRNKRMRAIEILGLIGRDAALNAILRALNDPEVEVRLRAIDVLAESDRAMYIGPIKSLANDPDGRVRSKVEDILMARSNANG
ncbi:MAG: HEAT repeat domain-containing protein [bacterium]